MDGNCLVPPWGTFGQGWMQKVHCCDKLALICPLKRGGSITANLLSTLCGIDRTTFGSRPEEMQCCHCPIWDIPESPKFSAPFIPHWSLYYPLSTSISDKTSLPRSLYLIFLAQMGCRRDLLLFPPTQSWKNPQSYIRMGCGWLEKNGFPAALYVLKPINWYSVSTTSCFAWQVKATLAWWDISGRTFPVPAWHNFHSHSSDVPD